MSKTEDVKEFIKKSLIRINYSFKFKKLGIKKGFADYLIERCNMQNVTDVLKLVKKSSNKTKFKKNIVSFIKENPNNVYNQALLIGNLLGIYNYYDYFTIGKINPSFIDNYDEKNKDKIISILRENFYEYIMSNNELKNEFYTLENGIRNFNSELNKDEIEKIFDDVILGKDSTTENLFKTKEVHAYISQIVGNYELDDIINNFEFIKLDIDSNHEESLEDRRKKYNEHKNLSENQMIKISHLEELKEKLSKINNSESKELLNKLNRISNPYDSIDEIEDIYLEYETLFREDIVNRLYIPEKQETIIEDFKDVKPQLIHMFIRNVEQFRIDLEEKIKKEIISERINKSESQELTLEELEQFKNRIQGLDDEINQAKVNYSFDSSVGAYNDPMGIAFYKSDTSNQISGSIYSEDYFNIYRSEMLGIGFNAEGLIPEAIALSSPSYITTNKGLNNLEYNEKDEFNLMSACYEDLKKNDGNSEIVLFRRNLDYDTKASYIFVAFDSEYPKNNEILLNEARTLAKDNNMKLVIYDLYKIRESYKKHSEMLSQYEEKDESLSQDAGRIR